VIREAVRQRVSPANRLRRPKITLLIPALNEEKNLPWVLHRVPKMVDEVLLVDGRSIDRTVDIARELRPGIGIVMQDGRGKGNAIKCGIKAATGDIIVMLDADGSMNPDEISKFIEPLVNGYDFVRGSRFLRGGGTADMEGYRKIGNHLFVFLVSMLYWNRSSDLCYGYMAFKRDAVNNLGIESDGFEIETELTIKAMKAGLIMKEIPSFEGKRLNGVGNLRAFSDGKRILKTILKLRLSNTLKN
jgi:glycosyltransferase involved in cell wall biosynthesis